MQMRRTIGVLALSTALGACLSLYLSSTASAGEPQSIAPQETLTPVSYTHLTLPTIYSV